MITETREIYKCEYCNKLYQIKRFADYHELMCKKNPRNKRACFGCINLSKKTITDYFDMQDGEHEREVKLLYCKKLECFLYPPQVEMKQNAIDLDGINKPMPKKCEYFKDISYE